MSKRPNIVVLLIAVGVAFGYGLGRWGKQPGEAAPPNANGSSTAVVDLNAPAPRGADGKPDLSGIWQAESLPRDIAIKINPNGVEGAQTLGESVPGRHFMSVMWDLKPDEVTMLPAAAEVFKSRGATLGRDIPSSFCLPLGVPLMDGAVFPHKIVQTPELVVILYEELTMFRQIFTDGRPLPEDPEPAFTGHSIGKWEGDVLVIEANGFRDGGWLDASGHPHSSAMRLTERFHRRNVGTLEVQVTVDDPKTYNKPFTYSFINRLMPGEKLYENICENEKFRPWLDAQSASTK
jgi:hypothetical protein